MGSLAELQKILHQQDERIKELESDLAVKDELIQELTSRLDKYKSVLHVPTTTSMVSGVSGVGGARKIRAQGISAEPQTPKTLQDLGQDTFKPHPKSLR